jgi:hypothetical protein
MHKFAHVKKPLIPVDLERTQPMPTLGTALEYEDNTHLYEIDNADEDFQ